jgi:hypothetical protein
MRLALRWIVAATVTESFSRVRTEPTFTSRCFAHWETQCGFVARYECISSSAPSRIEKAASFSSAAVDPASTSPDLLAPFGEFAATMCRVAFCAFYRHLAASLFLRLLFLPVARRYGFVMRSACVIQGHLPLLHVKALLSERATCCPAFPDLQFQLLA